MDYANLTGRLTLLLAATLLIIWPVAGAEGQDSEEDSVSNEAPERPVRRVRRLGDVVTEGYDLDLVAPKAASASTGAESRYNLGNQEQTEKLTELLAVLAVRPGDRTAQGELEDLLNDVLDRANGLLDSGRSADAMQLLTVVQEVNPRKSGLDSSMARAATVQQTARGGRSDGAPGSGLKLGTTQSLSQFNLPDPAQTERLEQLLSTISARPGYTPALNELNDLLDQILLQAEDAMMAGDFAGARQMQDVVRAVNPRKRGLSDSRTLLAQSQEIVGWMAAARRAEQAGILIEPLLDSAYYYYRQVLSVNPEHAEALAGMRDIQAQMLTYALDAAKNYDFELSDAWLEEAAKIGDESGRIARTEGEINTFRAETAQSIEQNVVTAIQAGDYNLAEFNLVDLIALGGFENRVTALREMMIREENYGQYEAGQVIQDRFDNGAGYAPSVVVISAGSFVMGTPDAEDDRADNESPQHRVMFERGFGLGEREVTVAEFRAFIEDSGYRTEAERQRKTSVWDEEAGQLMERPNIDWEFDYAGEPAAEDLPVLHVTWNDANAYVQWLSARTGFRYRLPTEAEFEYAIRADTRSPYWWGEGRPKETVENLAGERDKSPSQRSFGNYFRKYGDDYFGPAPVGSFTPNPWGLFDMAGNVSEWVQDCWHPNYVRAPNNGGAWENTGCGRRVVRGGYWASAPTQARSGSRMSAPIGLHAPQLGFRVARDLF